MRDLTRRAVLKVLIGTWRDDRATGSTSTSDAHDQLKAQITPILKNPLTS